MDGSSHSGSKGRKEAAGKPTEDRPAPRALPLSVSREELLVDGSDREFRRLVHDLFAFFARHETVRAGHARRIGLAGIEYTVLIAIARLSLDGDVGVKEVAAHLRVSGAFITTVVGKLQRNGLIDKRPSARDRRRVCLTITDKSHDLLNELAPAQRQVNDVEFGPLTREEFRSFGETIRRLIESADQAISLQHYLESQSPDTKSGTGDRKSRRSRRRG